MKKFLVGIMAAAVLVSMARVAMAQAKTVKAEMRVETATVEAIEAHSRTITLKKPDGTFVETVAGPEVKRFAEIKIGDKVTARYYETIVIHMKPNSEPGVDTTVKTTTPSGQVHPGGTSARQHTITAVISAIDMKAPSITFKGPNGFNYTSRVQDTTALAKVKVGDRVDIVWTEAKLLSLEPGT
jgi:Cu/Zn superoxide dismutase